MVVPVVRVPSRGRGYSTVVRQPRLRDRLISATCPEDVLPCTTEEEQAFRASFAPMVAPRGPPPKRVTAFLAGAAATQPANPLATAPVAPSVPGFPNAASRPHSSLGMRTRPRPPSAGGTSSLPVRREGSHGAGEQVVPSSVSPRPMCADCLPPTPSSRAGSAIGSARRSAGAARTATAPSSGSGRPLPSVVQVSNSNNCSDNTAADRARGSRTRSTSEFALYIQSMGSGGGSAASSAAPPATPMRGYGFARRPPSPTACAPPARHAGPVVVQSGDEDRRPLTQVSSAAPGFGAQAPEWMPAPAVLVAAAARAVPQPRGRSPSPPPARPGVSWRCGSGCGPEGWLGREIRAVPNKGDLEATATGSGAARLVAEVRARRRERCSTKGRKENKEKHLVLPFVYNGDDARYMHLDSVAAAPLTTRTNFSSLSSRVVGEESRALLVKSLLAQSTA